MLKLLYVESINGDTNRAGYRVLNTAFISRVQTTETTKAKLWFNAKPDRQRGKDDVYVVSESRAEVKAAMDSSLSAKTLALDIYPDNDSTKTPVTTVLHASEIVMAYPHVITDHTKSWIVLSDKGWNHKRYLTTSYFVDIADLARTGSTTTTSTSTTSTSSTSTTSTSTTSTTTS